MDERRDFSGHKFEEMLSLMELLWEKADPALVKLFLKGGHDFLERVGSSRPPDNQGPDWQHRIIAEEMPIGASILDLGCGEGALLSRLSLEREARVQGVELDADKVAACVEKGIPVIQTDLDLGLKGFPDKLFDYVILEETLQTLRHPDAIIAEMRRVGRRGIVSFPNFGFWRVRLDLAVRGRMPVTDWLPHRWYRTPNIHLFSIRDFMDYAEEAGLNLTGVHVLENGAGRPFREGDNLYAEEALVFFE